MTKERMKCPVCGASMNNHAEKVSFDMGEGRYNPDPEFGGILEEILTCPGCGNVEMRKAN